MWKKSGYIKNAMLIENLLFTTMLVFGRGKKEGSFYIFTLFVFVTCLSVTNTTRSVECNLHAKPPDL